ncbi:MAG TPA: DUF899 family protein [Thermoanaerobaculia bacterium]|jgi:predicted dithiol-disulfide oxidoreductase (DUF899 family)
MSKHSVRFPGENQSYRSARDELLDAEIALRRNLEEVSAKRRKLPLGGEIREDYTFDNEKGPIRMSQLFADGKDTLVVYSFMYGPKMPEACPLCTSILDGMDGEAPHIMQRVNFAVIAKSPIERIRKFARERGWRNLPLLSSANNTYNHDYHAEEAKGGQMPALNVFVRRNGRIHHFYNTELLYAPNEKGQDGRHVDLIWPLWNVFDYTPDGRGNWNPRLSY